MKVRFGILWAILAVALLVGFPALFFLTVPGTYTLPAPGSTAAQVPPLPVPSSSGANLQGDALLTISAEVPEGVSAEEQKTVSDVWIAARTKAFYERHPTLPEKKNHIVPTMCVRTCSILVSRY